MTYGHTNKAPTIPMPNTPPAAIHEQVPEKQDPLANYTFAGEDIKT